MRSLWGDLTHTAAQRQTAYALVSITFEVAVMTAPVLVAVITALASPGAAVLVAAALCSAGGFAFSLTAGSRRWRGEPHDVSWLGPLAAAGMRALLVVLLAFGVAVGHRAGRGARVRRRARLGRDRRLAARRALGRQPHRRPHLRRALVAGHARPPAAVLLALLGAGFALLSTADAPLVLAALLALPGLVLAPSTVVGSTLLDHVAPPGTATESFAVLVMGIVAGSAVGNALGGALVDERSYEFATLTAGALAALGGLLAYARRASLAASAAGG